MSEIDDEFTERVSEQTEWIGKMVDNGKIILVDPLADATEAADDRMEGEQ